MASHLTLALSGELSPVPFTQYTRVTHLPFEVQTCCSLGSFPGLPHIHPTSHICVSVVPKRSLAPSLAPPCLLSSLLFSFQPSRRALRAGNSCSWPTVDRNRRDEQATHSKYEVGVIITQHQQSVMSKNCPPEPSCPG